jgi:large subunit ribosomal protein L29
MDLKKIREMTDTELTAELKKKKNELFNLRFQHVTGQLDNPIKMRDVKKDIARVMTIMRENELKNAKAQGKENAI